jgi:hypothetical protein
MHKRFWNLPSLDEASEATMEVALQYAAVLPGGDLPRSKAALKDYESIYFDAEGRERLDVSKTKNLLVMRERIAAKIDQVLQIKEKLAADGLRRSGKLAEERTWDRKVLETGFLPEKDFGAEKRTISKMAQEILSSEYELVSGLKDYQVANVIIDPEKITDTLLINLGLEEFVPEKKAGEVEKIAKRAEAIPDIKEMLRGLEPLEINRQRRKERKILRLFTITEGEYQGYILGTQVNHGQKLLFRTDIHGAVRRLENIRQGYEEEIMELAKTDEEVRAIKDFLNEHKKEIYGAFQQYLEEKKAGNVTVMDKPEVMKEYEQRIADLLDNLGGVINGEKIKIQQQLKASQNLIETQTRPARIKTVKGKQVEIPAEERENINIESKLARLSAIHDAFAKRMQEIRGIQTYLLADEQILKVEVSRMEAPFAEFVTKVEELHEKFKLYRKAELSGPEKAKIAANIERLITEPLESSFPEGKVALEPYGSFKAAMIEQSEKTITTLDDQDINVPAKEFTKIYLIAKIVRLHKDLQKFYADNLSGVDPKISEKTLAEIEEIKLKFGERKVAPQVEVMDFEKQYDQFYHLVNSLKKRIVEILAEEEKKKIKEIRNAAKERFRNFDFAEVVRELRNNEEVER